MAHPSELIAQIIAVANQQDWQRVEALTAQLLRLIPDHAGAHYFAGVAALARHQLGPALQHLGRATALQPARADFAAQYAKALSVARMSSEALTVADRALALSPQHAMTLAILGNVYAQNQAHEQAVACFRQAATLMPENALHHFNLATAMIAVGDTDGAEAEFEACLAVDPVFWRAHLSLAHLRRQSTANNHVERLTTLLAHGHRDNAAEVCLNLALSKEYEDLAEYPEAFEHLLRGKAASRVGMNDSIRQDEALFEALARAMPQPSATVNGDPSPEPIFVFGMPRTGTTLVERILSSHSDVHAAGELQNFGIALKQAWGNGTPFWLDPDAAARVDTIDWQRMGAGYLASTRPATGHTARFVDKFPFNFLYAGFIARALPNAKLICLRRDPMDTCLGNFRQLFAEKLPYYNYSFDLLDCGRYYLLFDRLMRHWETVFPGRILQLRYEELVDAQEKTTRQLLDFCGLPWDDACLHFERNVASVATASSLQVREPMNRASVARWKKYEAQLGELRELLIEGGIELAR